MSTPVAAAISTEGLTKTFGASTAVSDITMQVDAGQVFGLLGPNGAGKTTLIRCLLDLIRPTSGRAVVLGEDVTRDGLAARARIGYLPGEFALWPGLTARETFHRVMAVRGQELTRRTLQLSERFGVELDRKLGQMSKGNKQKVGLVIALAPLADLYILDEPTDGLDPLVQQEFRRVVAEQKARGATMVLSSHVLHEVEELADRVAVLRRGELVTVERVDVLRTRAARPITVYFREAAPIEGLCALAGVEVMDHDADGPGTGTGDGRTAALRVRGSMDPLLKFLAQHSVESIVAPQAELEEVFLEYYGGSA